MEPGHPPRQDPPTEHSQDQVNGSPPRPKSRRGWMSDSPLDGGSGWPTSAYAIVPRQPAGPSASGASGAAGVPPQPPDAPPAEEPQPVPPASRRSRIAVLVIGLIVLVIAAVGGVLATRNDSDSAKAGIDATATTTPAPDATTGEPVVAVGDPSSGASGRTGAGAGAGAPVSGAAASGSAPASSALASGSAGATVPAAPPSTAILRTGTAQLAVLAGQSDDAYDFDSGLKQAAGADATAGALGLSAANGAKFAVLLGGDTPSLAACSAVPESRWTGQVLLAGLVPGSKVCMRTSEQRYAWFMTRAGQAINGALYSANLDYVVYKKSGE